MKFDMDGFDEYDKRLVRLSNSYQPMCKAMLKAATAIVKDKLRAANSVFASYVTGQAAKHSKFGGWYAKVGFGGTKSAYITSGNTYAARAATVYEYGRTAGTYEADYKVKRDLWGKKSVTMGDHKRHYPDQPARPFIRRTIDAAAPEVVDTMQRIYDEEVAKIFE